MNRVLLTTALALTALTAGAGCGDPLTDGDWRGLPTFVLRGAIHAVDGTEWRGELVPALVWTSLSAPAEPFATQPMGFSTTDFAAFEAQVHGAPPATALEAFPAPGQTGADGDAHIAVALLVVREADGLAGPLTGDDLYATVRGVAADHYLLWVDGADRLRDRVGSYVLNPIALRDGYNLAVGLCRPGRPSQLMVVPSERVGVVARSDAPAGTCLDVFWGAWRAP